MLFSLSSTCKTHTELNVNEARQSPGYYHLEEGSAKMPQTSPWATEKPKDLWWVQLAAQAGFHKTSCRARGLFQSFQCHTSKALDYTPPPLPFHKGIHPSYRLLYKLCKTMEQILCPKSRLDVYAREQIYTQAFKPAPFLSSPPVH